MGKTATVPDIQTEPVEQMFTLDCCPICGGDTLDYQRSVCTTKRKDWDWKVRCRPCNTNLAFYLANSVID